MLSVLKRLFGTANDREINLLRKEVEKINALEPDMIKLSDEQMISKTIEFKNKLESGTRTEDIKYEAFALVREAARRTLNMRHFDVQLIGGLILHSGKITEMRTGEGKTLVATLPAYLNALEGKGVHIVTINDYLAKRDAEWMGVIYRSLGLSVGYVINSLDDTSRQAAYACDVTYVTNNELGFDYLRDNMKYTLNSKVLRDFHYAIVDEVDAILIDEARTPLIISGPVDEHTDLYALVDAHIRNLASRDYEKDEKTRSVNLTEEGIEALEITLIRQGLMKEGTSLYDFENLSLVHYVNQALKARFIFKNEVDYIVRDGKVQIIDELTGRIMEGRRYSEGLHQALEAKEAVPIKNETQTLASITFQNYFRTYRKLSGMTGTAMTEASEFKTIYNLEVLSLPTHHPIKRIDCDDEIYGSKEEKYSAILKLIEECYGKGQPVLAGTISIEKSEELSRILSAHNIKHNILNAKFHEQEAQLIAQAGRYKTVTIATNMAGRGTDIKLGGNAEMLIEDLKRLNLPQDEYELKASQIEAEITENKQKVLNAGGLFVIGTERHESRRIDNQLRGRCGRQGDPGTTKFMLSLEDDLMRIFASDRISEVLRSLGLRNGETIRHPMITRSLEKAQQKVEAHNFEIRKNLLRFDDVMNRQRGIIYQRRNYIIGSEDLDEILNDAIEAVVTHIVNSFIPAKTFREDWDIEALCKESLHLLGIRLDPELIINEEVTEKEITEKLYSLAKDSYRNKCKDYGEDLMQRALKYVMITVLDQTWKDHLYNLDHLRQGISLRAYGQKDPLSEYKREAFALFEKMLYLIQSNLVQNIFNLHIDSSDLNTESLSLEKKKAQTLRTGREDPAFTKYNAGLALDAFPKSIKNYVAPQQRITSDPNSWGKVSRNEICPCGSGKKYKHCHGNL
jgi:preprotein translocase subunit SecA